MQDDQQEGKTLDDFFKIQGGVLNLKGILQTINFVSNKKGIRIDPSGLNANGGTITGATVSGGSTSGTIVAGVTGVLYGNGSLAVTAITPLSGTKTYYVSDSSGGAVNRKLTFQNGVLISET